MFDMIAAVSLRSSKVLNEVVSKRDENWVKLADDSIEQQKVDNDDTTIPTYKLLYHSHNI